MVVFELFPWHSKEVSGGMRPPPDIINEFVWSPISELSTDFVFAFGREWDHAASALSLTLRSALGNGGIDYGSTVASRSVRIYDLPSGQQLVVEWHSGSAGPPSSDETERLRHALSS